MLGRTVWIVAVALLLLAAIAPGETVSTDEPAEESASDGSLSADDEAALEETEEEAVSDGISSAGEEAQAASSEDSGDVSWVGEGFQPAPPAMDPRYTVVPSGAFTYTYPIVVPAGTAGVQPDLAISYNSAADNGMLGVGFALTGLPTIERDPSYPITFTEDDHYIYQGQKLIYSAEDGCFHAERETFERIRAYATASEETSTSNPNTATSHWVVERKDGSKLYFGNSDTSRINAVGKGGLPRLWALNRYEDVHDNFYGVAYAEDESNGDYYPSKILYTKGHGLAVFKAVVFEYQDRTDHCRVYTPTRVDTDQRLKWITIRAGVDIDGEGGDVVRKYRIDYEYSPSTKRSRITALRQFGTEGTGQLPPVTFDYQDANCSFAASPWTDADCESNERTGDFDGDGRTDFMQYIANEGWQVWLSTGESFADGGTWSSAKQDGSELTGDFDGDGKTDFIRSNSSGWWFYRSTGHSFARSADPWIGWSVHETQVTGDFNGDGRTDVLQYRTFLGWYVMISTGTSFAASPWLGAECNNHSTVGDFNGDGKTDFMQSKVLSGLHVRLSTGSSFTDEVWSEEYLGAAATGDFNGDGKTDFVDHQSGGVERVYLSTGSTFAGSVWATPGYPDSTISGDFNGDGRTDLLLHMSDGSGWRALLSTGHSFVDSGLWSTDERTGTETAGDFDGDGKMDLLQHVSDDTGWQVLLSAGPAPDLVVTVAYPEGGHADVTYSPAPQVPGAVNPSVSEYPTIADSSPRALVTRMSLDNNIGSTETVTTDYTYSQGMQASGRRPARDNLGFRTVKQSNDEAGTRTVTVYRQDRPFHGLVDQSFTCAWNGTTQGAKYLEHINHYTSRVILGDSHIRFLELTDTIQRSWDGQSTSWDTQTKYVYGEYGDVTQRKVLGTVDYSDDVATDRNVNDNVIEDTVYAASSTHYVVKPVSKTVRSYNGSDDIGTASLTRYYYDGSLNLGDIDCGLLTATDAFADATTAVRTRTEYDAYGNPHYLYDGNDNRTALGYDSYHALVRTKTNARSQTETTEHDEYCRPSTVTDINGQVTTTIYDRFGRVAKTVRPGDDEANPTVWVRRSDTEAPEIFPRYVHTTQKTTETNALERYDYFDGLGRLMQTKSEGGSGQWVAEDYFYDGGGRNNRVSVPRFSAGCGYSSRSSTIVTTREYDPLGRVVLTTFPDTTTNRIVYRRSRTVRVDARDHATAVETDQDDGRVATQTRYTGVYPSITAYSTVTTRTYRNVKKVEDAASNIIYVYLDWLGRKWKYVDPDKGTWLYYYDANSNLIKQRDGCLQETTFTYDVLDRLTRKHCESGTDAVYTYDGGLNGKGRLTRVTYNRGRDSYTYDERGRVVELERKLDEYTNTMRYTYDSADRLHSTTYPDDETVTCTYGGHGLLTRVAGQATYVSSITYDAAQRVLSMVYRDGDQAITTAYNYYDAWGEEDPVSGLTLSYRLRYVRAGTSQDPGAVLSLTYAYDAGGNVKQKTDNNNASYSEEYTYDALDRLTAVTGVYGHRVYSYDEVDNIVTKDGQTYVYSTEQPHAVTSKGSATYTYDDNGNMTSRNGQTIAYDAAGRMVSITGTGAGTFSYGPDTKRTIKEEGTKTTYYFFPLYEEEYTDGSLSRTLKYYTANGQVVAQRSSVTSEGLQFYYADHLGSSVVLTNADGSVAFTAGYKPYGEDAYTSGTCTTRYRFTGQEKETGGLYYYGARYYDPSLGRFIQADSVLDGLNRYAYCHNNPVRYTDPTGLGAENEVGDGRIYDDTTGKYYNSDGTLCSNQSDTVMGDDEGTNSVEDGGGSGGGGGSGEGGSGGAGVGEKVRVAGAALLTGTLAEDVFTGGAGVFDDLITVPAAVAAVIVGTILMATADDADMPEEPKPSTGRTEPGSLKEKLAMEQAKGDPGAGRALDAEMGDPRWPASEGWVKMAQNVNGVEIHYVFNTTTGATADFKFK